MKYENGMYLDISNADYHSAEGISKSTLDKVAQGASQYLWSLSCPLATNPNTKALDIGTLIHCMLGEHDEFEKRYIVQPDFGDLRLKENKAQKQAWEEERANSDLIVISQDEMNMANDIYASCLAHPLASKYITDKNAISESSIFVTDKDTGLQLKVRPDILLPHKQLIVDIKTTSDFNNFEKSIDLFRYDVQQAMYTEVVSKHYGVKFDFVFLVVSTKQNMGRYPVKVVKLAKSFLSKGKTIFRRDVERLKEIIDKGITDEYCIAELPFYYNPAMLKKEQDEREIKQIQEVGF